MTQEQDGNLLQPGSSLVGGSLVANWLPVSQCRVGVASAMAAPSPKMPTVEAFCSSQGLEGVWLERAKQLVAEVPGEELDCSTDPIFVMFCRRGARIKAGRVQGKDWAAQRGAGGTCWEQTAQRGIFSCQVSCLTNPYQT